MQDKSVCCSAIRIVKNGQGLIRSYYQTDHFSSFCLLRVYMRQTLVRLGMYGDSMLRLPWSLVVLCLTK